MVQGELIQLRHKDKEHIKKLLRIDQQDRCYLCDREFSKMKPRDICLDHDHETGLVRAVLCRPCNSLEGKYYRLFIRVGHRNNKVDYPLMLRMLASYKTFPPKTLYLYPVKVKRHKRRRKR